ncbi:MAG: hypothetical protein SOT13_07500, partial [Candidatus Aphodousia sp.]|nr:hypothetical protein [Candidatus Aphodousia sp.]
YSLFETKPAIIPTCLLIEKYGDRKKLEMGRKNVIKSLANFSRIVYKNNITAKLNFSKFYVKSL